MDLASVSEADLGRTLRFRAECDATALRLNATEGYLLSRIDGHTPWRVLREIGGMAPSDVDVCIEEWISAGVVEMCAPVAPPRAPRKPVAEPPRKTPGQIDESELDESLDLDLETQRKILDFESRLGSGYARLLGVAPDADVKEIKLAYRRLSREYHPDRYFRREIGRYEGRLEAIFKKVSEAYELLSDPATRAEVQKAEAIEVQSTAPPAAESGASDTSAEPSRPLTPIERLRQRMPFKIPETVLAERRRRAHGFFDSARTWAENGHYLEAASGIRLAIAFDPYEEKYKETFADIQAGLAEQRVRELTTKAGDWNDATDFNTGLKLCDEALLYKPHDPELNATAARLAIGLKDAPKAREYLDTALAHSPDVGRYHRLLAEIHRLDGSRGHAIRELERAISLDSSDDEAKQLLEALKPRRRAP